MPPKKHPRETAAPVPPRTPASPPPHRKGWLQWIPTDDDQLEIAEQKMLKPISTTACQRFIRGVNTISSYVSRPKTLVEVSKEETSDRQDTIESFVEPPRLLSMAGTEMPEATGGDNSRRTLILVHGFGGGVGNWVRNWDVLIQDYNVHMVDLPGFARSIREPIDFKSPEQVIEYYETSMLSWLDQLPEYDPSQRIDVLAHSFGAFLMGNIVHRNPSRFRHIILADPWGVAQEDEGAKKRAASLPFRFKLLSWVFYNTSPLGVLRWTGPWGPTLMPKVRPDFAARWVDAHEGDPYVFYDYTYHSNSNGRPTGEYAFQAMCTGMAFSKRPLVHLIDSWPKDVALSIVYGAHTWMDKEVGRIAVERLIYNGRLDVSYDILPNAGHQLFTDNVDGFNALISSLLKTKGVLFD